MIERRGRINLFLSTSAFAISSAGSVLLNIVFATTIYRSTGSGLLTSLFLSLQWLPILAIILYKSDWEDGVDPRKRWIRLDLTSAALTLPIYLAVLWAPENYWILFVLLFARGLVDHVNRITKTIAARVIFPANKTPLYASILQTSFHLGIGLAAIIGITVGGRFSLTSVVLFDLGTYLAAALLMSFSQTLYPKQVEENLRTKSGAGSIQTRMRDFLTAIKSDPRLFFSVMLPFISSTFFQGTYSVFQPIFPTQVLKLGREGITVSHVLASIAIVGGSTFFAYLSKKYEFFKKDFKNVKKNVFVLSAVSAGSYLLAVATLNPWLSAICFTLMIFTFEMIYMFGYAGIVAFSPPGKLGSIFAITFCLGCSAASLCVVLAGSLLDYLNNNFLAVAGMFMGGYWVLLSLGSWFYQKMIKKLETQSENLIQEMQLGVLS